MSLFLLFINCQSLSCKQNSIGPHGFNRRQHNSRIDEQKRELESEQRRRQQEEMEHRSLVRFYICRLSKFSKISL